MSKRDYLESLREFLSYELPSRLVESNIRFYEEYFDEQLRLGRSLQEIEDELGDPQLIARSCIDAAKCGKDGIPNSADDNDFTEEIERESLKGRTREKTSADREQNGQNGQNGSGRIHFVSGWGCLVAILIFIVVTVGCLIAFFSTPFGLTVLVGLLIAGLIFRIFTR